jgi:hypothetical protein
LGYSFKRLGVPFIAPRQLGAVESNLGRQFLPSVAWRTGQSGAHRTLSGADFFPSLAKPTVGAWELLAHRTLSGAHRTVRCPLPTVGSATCLAQIAQPTVGPADRWRTGQSGAHRTVRCTPDSPVNYSCTPSMKSREQRVRTSQPGAPDTVPCTTGQSGAPRLSIVLAARAKTFPIVLFLFPALRHNILVSKTMY